MEDLIKKFKFKGRGVIFNAPTELLNKFMKLGMTVGTDNKTKTTDTLVFLNNYKELTTFLSQQLGGIEYDSVLWLAFPKISSGVKTDINRDKIIITAEDFGITAVTAISIDDIWSGLRFRPIECVEKK